MRSFKARQDCIPSSTASSCQGSSASARRLASILPQALAQRHSPIGIDVSREKIARVQLQRGLPVFSFDMLKKSLVVDPCAGRQVQDD